MAESAEHMSKFEALHTQMTTSPCYWKVLKEILLQKKKEIKFTVYG